MKTCTLMAALVTASAMLPDVGYSQGLPSDPPPAPGGSSGTAKTKSSTARQTMNDKSADKFARPAGQVLNDVSGGAGAVGSAIPPTGSHRKKLGR